jgi:hypothetical protein
VASFCCLCGSIAARSGRAILARGTGTSGYLLRHALASALCTTGRQTAKLSEETRWQIASETVEELRRYADWNAFDEKAPTMTAATNSY